MNVKEHKLLNSINVYISVNYWLGIILGGIFSISCYQAIFGDTANKIIYFALIIVSVAFMIKNQSDIPKDSHKAVREACDADMR